MGSPQVWATPPARCSQPPTLAVPGNFVHSHRLPPTPSPSSLVPQLCHVTSCHAASPHVPPVPPEPWLGTNSSALPIPHVAAGACPARVVWSPRPWRGESHISLLYAGAHTLSCPSLVLGKEPLNESTGGATSKPQDPGARLRTPGDLLQGGMVPRSSGMWSGARQPSRLHCLPLPAWEQCPSWPGHGLAMVLLPRAVPSPPLSPSLFHSHLLKPPQIQGTHLLPNHLLLSLCGSGGRTCVLAVPGGR